MKKFYNASSSRVFILFSLCIGVVVGLVVAYFVFLYFLLSFKFFIFLEVDFDIQIEVGHTIL